MLIELVVAGIERQIGSSDALRCGPIKSFRMSRNPRPDGAKHRVQTRLGIRRGFRIAISDRAAEKIADMNGRNIFIATLGVDLAKG